MFRSCHLGRGMGQTDETEATGGREQSGIR